VIRWEDPPPRAGSCGGYDWCAIVAALRGHPRRWALVATYAGTQTAAAVAGDLRVGGIKAAGPAGCVEAVARTVDGQSRVYARYVGEVTP
jgi:hypothetical protein